MKPWLGFGRWSLDKFFVAVFLPSQVPVGGIVQQVCFPVVAEV